MVFAFWCIQDFNKKNYYNIIDLEIKVSALFLHDLIKNKTDDNSYLKMLWLRNDY